MKNILTAILLLTLFACQSTQNQIEDGYRLTQDEFKDFKRYSMPSAGELDGAPMLSLSQAFIEVFTDVKKESVGTTLAVILHYEGWVFINPGESLVLLVDGEKMPFVSPSGSAYNRGVLKGLAGAVGGIRVREEAHYPITVEQIKKLAYAQDVKVRIYGSQGNVTREFNEDYFESLRAYYEKFILPNGIVSI